MCLNSKQYIVTLDHEVYYTTFVNVEAIKKAQKFASIGTQYVDNISRLVLVSHKKLQDMAQ